MAPILSDFTSTGGTFFALNDERNVALLVSGDECTRDNGILRALLLGPRATSPYSEVKVLTRTFRSDQGIDNQPNGQSNPGLRLHSGNGSVCAQF